jgi:hypothetical protein
VTGPPPEPWWLRRTGLTDVWWLRPLAPSPWWLRPNPHALARPVLTPTTAAKAAPAAKAKTGAVVAVGTAEVVATVAGVGPLGLARAPHATGSDRVPLSVALLRLHTVRLRPWQRILLFEGTFFAAVVIALADFATAWLPLVVPPTVGAMLKLHDVVLTQLHRNPRRPIRR